MKKFFSLVCAVLLVFSASAAPVAQKAQLVKKAPVAVEQMQKVQLEQAQVANFKQFNATPALTVSNQKAQTVRGNQMLKKAQAPARRSAANARKVVNAPLNTNITIGTFSPATYEGEYYVTLTDANSTRQFFFDFDTSVNPFEVGKTYTLDEMIADYVAMGDADDWYAWEPATAATYTETVDEKGLTHIVASMTTESDTYDITYDQPEPQDIDVTAVDWAYNDYYYDVYVYAENTTYLFELKESTGGLTYGTTYKYADMEPSWTCTLTSGGYPGITATDATLTVTKDDAGLIHIAATMVLNGNKHIIAYDEKPFEPSGVQINVEGTDLNGRYMSGYGFYLYTATWGDYTVQLAFDAEEEKAAYTNDDFIADYGLIYSNSEQIQLLKLASDNITITNTETTKTLAGSIFAKNGDEYILNLVYEKPDAKYIDINVADATIFTKALAAGYWTIGGKNAAKDMDINLYFISKNIEGTFTAEDMDAYSTWLDDSSTGTKISYQNLSAANINSAIVGDSLILEGTMTLADNNGGEANVTLHVSTPYSTETWGEWADFAPFGLNTGKFVFSAILNNPTTQVNLPVQVREDADGNKQFKVSNWGKGIFSSTGQDLIINMDKDGFLTSVPVNLGDLMMYGDIYAEGIDSVDAKFDAENGIFPLAMSYTIPDFYGIEVGNAIETLTMDKPILERDTVEVTADMKLLAEPAKGIIKVSAELNDTTYILEVVGADTVGTFSLADGTLSQQYYYGIVSAAGNSDFAEGEVTIAKNETGLKLNGLMIGVDEKAYVLDWTYTPITERDTVYVNSNTLDAFYQGSPINGYVYQSSNTDYELIQFVTKSSEKLGTFAVADINFNYSAISADGETNYIFFQNGEFTVSEDEEGFKLIGTLIGEDEKAYVFNLVQPVGVLEKDTDAPFDATFAWNEMDASIDNGVISISAQKGTDLALELVLFTDPANIEIPEGTYTISDSQEAGTALKSIGYAQGANPCFAATFVQEDKLYLDDMWFIVEGTITLSYDEYGKLKVVVDGKNSYGQPVTALVQYEKLEPKDVVEVIDAEFAVNEGYVDQYGIMNFYGANADGFEFDLYAYSDTIAGDFLDVIDFGDCELTLADGTSVGVIDAGEFKVERDGKNLTLIAKVLGSDTVQYNITATGYMGALPYDQTSDFEATFELEKAEVQTAAAGTGMTTLTVSNADNQMVALQFYAKADGNKLPARTYPINSTKAKNTVMASQGYTTSGFTYSFAAEIDGEGSITAPWWIVSGEVVVAEDGSITVNALNSLDKTITISIVATFTDLININAAVKATKVVRNGRMMVIKDAKVYSVLGQQIQ